MTDYDIIVIGGGSAGMAAATAAKDAGAGRVVILETDGELGGVLRQCIHNGFGLHTFGEELTGPEYARRFIDLVHELGIEYKLYTPVLEITNDRVVTAISREEGYLRLRAGAVVLAMGCRERAGGNIGIAGTRPAGVMTAGTAQRYINIDGYKVGHRIVILGSGDIGLIMARRLTLEGAEVVCVAELMPHSNGLTRNIVQCLEDFDIPLLLSHTVTKIYGKNRVEGVDISKVDPETLIPIDNTAVFTPCDTLLLSIGLIPEVELTRDAGVRASNIGGIEVDNRLQSSQAGIFACGNVVQVHDLVDFAAAEGTRAGLEAARFVLGKWAENTKTAVTEPGLGVSYVAPQRLILDGSDIELCYRVRATHTNAVVVIEADGKEVKRIKRPFMAPGEMEKAAIHAVDLPETGFSKLSVRIEA